MEINQSNITVGQRLTAPTPKFFKTLRTVGVIVGAVGVAVATGGVAIPALATISGYLITAGAVASAVSSLPVDFEKLKQQQKQAEPAYEM